MTKSKNEYLSKGNESSETQRSNPMILGGAILALLSAGILIFVIKTKIF